MLHKGGILLNHSVMLLGWKAFLEITWSNPPKLCPLFPPCELTLGTELGNDLLHLRLS